MRYRFLHEAVERLRAVRPQLIFGFNHAGDPAFCEIETDALADWLSVEFHPPHFAKGGVNARVMRARGKPFELMLPESEGSWGDWTVMTTHTMRTMGAIAAAHGGAPIVGHVPYPGGDVGGRLAESVVDTIADTFACIDARAAWLNGAESVPVGAVLLSAENWRAVQAREGLAHRPSAYLAWRGATDLLADNNIHFDVITDSMLERFVDYEFLLVSGLDHASHTTVSLLRQYIEGGGTLVSLGVPAGCNARGGRQGSNELADVLGLDVVEDAPYSVAYLDALDARIAEGLPDMPLLLKAAPLTRTVPEVRSVRVRAREGAEVWARFTEPCLEPDVAAGRHIYHMHSPPHTRTDWPAIVHGTFGKGRAVTVCGPMGLAYNYRNGPVLRRLLRNILAALGLPRALRIEGPAGMETVFTRQGGRRVLHLIARTVETAGSPQAAEGWQVRGVRVRMACEGASSVTLQPQGAALAFETTDDGIAFTVPPFEQWTIVAVQQETAS